jgi:hypothetical protein
MFAAISSLRSRMFDQIQLMALSDIEWTGIRYQTSFDIGFSSFGENEEKIYILDSNGHDMFEGITYIEIMQEALTMSDAEWKETIGILYTNKKEELAREEENKKSILNNKEKQKRYEQYLALKKEFEQ